MQSDPILRAPWSTTGPVTQPYVIGPVSGATPDTIGSRPLNVSGFGLQGTIAPHLRNLTFLCFLNIRLNNFMGPIPSDLSSLRR
ncbi:hypothetical protein ACS0TY_003096 [Phlomoides rotata]